MGRKQIKITVVGATEPLVVLPPGVPYAYSPYARDISLEDVIAGIWPMLYAEAQK